MEESEDLDYTNDNPLTLDASKISNNKKYSEEVIE